MVMTCNTGRRFSCAALAAAFFVISGATASPAEELVQDTPEFKVIIVRPGDTLSKMAMKYLGDPMKWHALMRHNDIEDPNMIDPGMRLEIPVSLKETTTDPAEVVYATPNEVAYNYQGEGRLLVDGDFIPPEGLVSADEGTALLKLPDQSQFHLEPGAVVEMKGFYASKNEDGGNVFMTFLKSVEGRVKFEVSKVIGQGRFEVETPNGIVKVKGTSFAIEIVASGEMNVETYTGEVAVKLPGQDEEIPVVAGEGAQIDKGGTGVEKVRLLSAPSLDNEPATRGGQTIFSWPEVEGATQYIIYAGGDAEFTEPIKLGKADTNRLSVDGLPAGTYYWNAVAVDELGMRSPAEEPVQFEVR